MNRLRCPSHLVLCALLLAALPAAAADAGVDYAGQVKPLLRQKCYACHGGLKQKAGLRVDTVALMLKGGESGPAVTPGKAAASLLIERITETDPHERMPQEGEVLTADQIALLRGWIESGARGPRDETPEADPRQHWAYQPPKRASEDFDALMAARFKAKGLKPQAEAAPEVWLRRVYLDLIGIPPTAEEVRAFKPAEMPQVVDKLLASPLYGERWARHFMDIWRYSDWYGLGKELRNSQKHIWHWRDWIVESLNAGKGYDRMIIEMLAADEAAPTDRDALRATGFLCRNYYIFNRTTWLDSVVEHTSRAFLGVTMQCVKCHDHKYDPIAQKDYYRMKAIFEPYHVRLDAWPGVTDFEKDGLPRVFDLHLDRLTYRHVRGDDKNEDKSQVMTPGVPPVLGGEFEVKPVPLSVQAFAPGMSMENRRALDGEALQRVSAAGAALSKATPKDPLLAQKQLELAAAEAAMRSLRARTAADEARHVKQSPDAALDKAAAEATRTANALQTEVAAAAAAESLAKLKANPKPEKDAITKAEKTLSTAQVSARTALLALAKTDASYPSIAGSKVALLDYVLAGTEAEEEAKLGVVFPTTSTGRRLALARWIADQRNPLTARVLVNHLWTRHFGASLVPDVSDFGLRCPPPLHQDVLDTLAADFMEHGWSLKRLHRQMVLSQLYRASSSNAGAAATTLAADPDNTFYWRMNPRRLESQAVRDAVLSIAGKLDLRQGGPSIESSNEASPRRALYFVQNADAEHRFLGAFDNANVLECYRRSESIVPQQALALTNSKLTRECADAVAARMAGLDEPAFVHEAFITLLGRAPTTEEVQACSKSLATLRHLQSNAQQARGLFLQALFSHNDFITLR